MFPSNNNYVTMQVHNERVRMVPVDNVGNVELLVVTCQHLGVACV